MCKFLMFFLMAISCVASGNGDLKNYNNFPNIDSSGDLNPEPELIKYFSNMDFSCHNDSNTTPKESPAAIQAFSEFIKYNSEGEQIEGYWNNVEHRQKRTDLLISAEKAGSWKATYLNSVWAINYPSETFPADKASDKLRGLVSQGIPIVVYKYATYFYGRDSKTVYYLLSEAIKRGNPNAMAWVGGAIVNRAKELHPLGKQLLECAANQGYANAYDSLGYLSFTQGQRLDAYRLWETGVNKGCEKCIDRMRNLAKVRSGYAVHIPLMELMPELKAIKAFYDDDLFYQLTELPELRPGDLPEKLKFHPKDSELLNLLQLEKISLTQY